MTKFELKINSRLEIKTNESVFNSTIQNINEDSFFISIPMEKGYYVKFENGERLTVYCYWENTSVYKFESKVLGREKCGNMPLYKLTLPEKVERIQRREYVRINVISPIEIISKDKKGHGLLLDISGGGRYPPTASEEARIMEAAGKSIDSITNLEPGDLIFYGGDSNGRYKGIYHVAIYVGNGKAVEALNTQYGVVYQKLRTKNAIMVVRPS